MTEVIKQQPCQRSGGIITHCRAPGVGENEDVEANSEKTLFQEKKEGGWDQQLEGRCKAKKGCFLFISLFWVGIILESLHLQGQRQERRH